jgi:hypothetical protein|tara:strand:+ start:346 stop:573 length:228 start_codon:yes stop_codon:yes gene_type:complete
MTLTTDPRSDGVQAAFIKAHLKMCAVGMNPPRPLTKTKLLIKATNLTGLNYKRTEITQAIEDLQIIVDHYTGEGQ